MQQLVSRASSSWYRGGSFSIQGKPPPPPPAPRGWAREQACALVAQARHARVGGGAEPSHQETTGASGGVGPSRQETTGAVGNVGPSRRETPAAAGGVGPSRQVTMVAVGAPHAPEPLQQLVVCARSPSTTRATAVREVHRLIDQSVRNDVIQLKSLRSGPKICVAQLKSLIWVPEFVWYLSLN